MYLLFLNNMTLYSSLLAVHIIGAFGTGVLGLFVLHALAQQRAHLFSFFAYALAGGAVLQTLTGSLLALVSPSVTALSLCDNLMLYITPLVLLEAFLISRMHSAHVTVPVLRIVLPMTGSVLAFCVLVFVGV